jgi:hypothetical protein
MKVIALAALVLVSAVPLNAAAIISDNFSNGTSGGDLIGSTTSDGNSSYGGFVYSGLARYDNTVLPSLQGQMYANPGGGLAYVNLNTNLSGYNEYTLNFGDAFLSGGADVSNYTLLQGRATGVTLGYGFRLSINGAGNTDINYVAAEGGLLTSMGTYTGGQYLPNLAIRVVGNTQQLFIDGTAYGSAQATQGTFGGAASGLAWVTQGGDSFQYFNFDNLTVTAVPEPSTFTLLLLGGAAVAAFRYRGRGAKP